MTTQTFKSYTEIPEAVKNYFILVADVARIEDVPLSDINSFLDLMTEYRREEKEDEFEDGWIL